MKKLEIQVIVLMIMLTRFAERIFNPKRSTGVSYAYVDHHYVAIIHLVDFNLFEFS